jgi:RES domain-containing protein
MLDDRRLGPVLESVPLTSREGPFHRYVLHRYVALAVERRAPLHILTGEWARRTGGRFNYPGLFRVAYVAGDAETAQAEAERITAPYVHVPVRGALGSVLDLTRADVLGKLEASEAGLGRDWRMLNARGGEAPGQRLGHAAYRSGRIEAIAYHSTVRVGGLCLAVFPERLGPGSWLEIQDPDGILRERIP